MNHPSATRITVAPRARFIILLAAAWIMAWPGGGWSAPDYALSGRGSELEKVAVARTPAGPVTALDLLIFDDLEARTLTGIPHEVWLEPASPEAEPHLPAIRTAVERLAATQRLAARAGDWQPAADWRRVKSFGAAAAVWIEQNVIPQVVVDEADINRYYLAHPDDYLRRRSVQVRYIYLPAADVNDPAAMAKARADLESIAEQVRAGRLSFADAARISSSAPSAREGGLLPAFFEDTYFSAFEEQAFAMEQPGQISPVFAGPGGVYLQQLVEQHPPRNIPIATVAGEIRHRLQRDHVRHYFQYFMRRFTEQNITLNHSVGWQYMHLDAPIAQVNSATLLRPAFLRYYGDPTTVDYTVRWDLVLGGVGDWIEGETLMQDLEAKGLAGHPWIVRAGELAVTLARANRALAMAIPGESYNTPERALATLARQPDFAAGLRSVRVAELSIMTTGLESMKPSQRRATERLAEAIDKQLGQGEIPVQPRPLRLAGLLQTAGGDSAAALKSLRDQIKQTEWPGITIKVGEPEWHDLVPGTAWSTQLRGVEPGELGPSRTIGNLTSRHLVLEARPLDLTAQKARPLVLQTLAYEAAAGELFKQALAEVKKPGAIEFSFPVAAARQSE